MSILQTMTHCMGDEHKTVWVMTSSKCNRKTLHGYCRPWHIVWVMNIKQYMLHGDETMHWWCRSSCKLRFAVKFENSTLSLVRWSDVACRSFVTWLQLLRWVPFKLLATRMSIIHHYRIQISCSFLIISALVREAVHCTCSIETCTSIVF